MKRLAILCTHPIQYHAPIFKLLQERGRLDLHVFYSKPYEKIAYDHSFGQIVKWDIPLLEGYAYTFLSAGNQKKNSNLIQAIEGWHPDAVLVFGWAPPGHLSAMRYFKGRIPVWFRGDSTLLNERSGIRKWARRVFLHWVYRHVDLAFYVGTQNKRYFLKHGLQEHQLRFAPHAIDNERFADDPDKQYETRAAKWRQELGIQPNDFVILFAGKLEPIKNPSILLKAVKQANSKSKRPIYLLFVGSGELEEELKRQGDGITNIRFLGFQNQSLMPVAYRLANVYCLPSLSETWGLAVNEALACGRPAIVSDKVGCAVDLVDQAYLGRVFISGKISALIECILKECDQRQEEFERRQKFIRSWNFTKIVAALENVLCP